MSIVFFCRRPPWNAEENLYYVWKLSDDIYDIYWSGYKVLAVIQLSSHHQFKHTRLHTHARHTRSRGLSTKYCSVLGSVWVRSRVCVCESVLSDPVGGHGRLACRLPHTRICVPSCGDGVMVVDDVDAGPTQCWQQRQCRRRWVYNKGQVWRRRRRRRQQHRTIPAINARWLNRFLLTPRKPTMNHSVWHGITFGHAHKRVCENIGKL